MRNIENIYILKYININNMENEINKEIIFNTRIHYELFPTFKVLNINVNIRLFF